MTQRKSLYCNYIMRLGKETFVFTARQNGVFIHEIQTGKKKRMTRIKAKELWLDLEGQGFKGFYPRA